MRCDAWISYSNCSFRCNGNMKAGGLVNQNVYGRLDGQVSRPGDTIGPTGTTSFHSNTLKCEKCGHTISSEQFVR